MTEKVEIQGTLQFFLFPKGGVHIGSGFIIARVDTDQGSKIVKGILPGSKVGQTFRFVGTLRRDQYGEHLAFVEAEEVLPDDEKGILAYLTSGAIKGIGPKRGAKIVEAFGTDTFRVLEEEPEKLAAIKGITLDAALAMGEAFCANQSFAALSIKLQRYGLNVKQAATLFADFGEEAEDVVRHNPYGLLHYFPQMGFRQIDELAEKIGTDPEDPRRLVGGMGFLLGEASREGHTMMPYEDFVQRGIVLLGVSRETLEQVMEEEEGHSLYVERVDGNLCVYQPVFWEAEHYVATKLEAMAAEDPLSIEGREDTVIDMAQKSTGIRFSPDQRKALTACMRSNVSIITGGPGTGKTTIIRAILHIFQEAGLKTALAAPTGRAAKRIAETTGHEALTIHRLLEAELDPVTGQSWFGKNNGSPLDVQALIVDEASMIDLLLMEGLLKALPLGARLVLVGDADQLPSVQPGNVLADAIASDMFDTVALTQIYRQAEESLIVLNAHRIRQGLYPVVPQEKEEQQAFRFIKCTGTQELVDTILQLCRENPETRVLTQVNRGPLGRMQLNKRLQEVLGPDKEVPTIKGEGESFRQGDRVMQVKNNYTLGWRTLEGDTGKGVFNGDTGVVHSVDEEAGALTVFYEPDHYVRYEGDKLDELMLAYAMTVHKAQGSEFPRVVLPMDAARGSFSTRNLLYTAVTRASEEVILVGSPRVMNAMVDNGHVAKRWSGLQGRLEEMLR